MQNLKVLILEGGFNEEHEVSLSTGLEVKKSLNNLVIIISLSRFLKKTILFFF